MSKDCKYAHLTYEDYCYECTGYGDDYYIDDDGELVKFCDKCPFNDLNDEEDE